MAVIREIRTVVYEGIFPICQGKVDVIQSGKEFHSAFNWAMPRSSL
ncbi:hypothetical protein [Colwellia sp. E150_009]